MKLDLVILVALTASIAEATATQTRAHAPQSREQTHFNVEQEYVGAPVRRPVVVPKPVLEILIGDKMRAAVCAKAENIPVGQIPKEWFIASAIHLDGAADEDLVVQPRDDLDVTPSNRCLSGANVGPFWIVRHVSNGYQLILNASGHDLDVLGSRTMGYRDIEVSSETVSMVNTSIYKFDGQKYKIYSSKLEPIN
jgi:hypothetical protein